MKRVVITGLGALTPIGNNVNEYWQNLLKGTSGAASITKFDTSHFRTKFACEIKNFDPTQFIEKTEIRKNDLYTQYAFVCVDECLRDSGLNLAATDLNRVGVIWATGIGGFQSFENEMISYCDGGKIPRFGPLTIPKIIPNIASGMITIKYGFRGMSYATSSACGSSNTALADAFNLIRLGKANIIITGGSEAAVSPAGVGSFGAMRALSERNDSPETASRPFDKTRDGFVIGEGGGALMVEELEHALKRGAKIYAEIAGVGYASDAYHITASHPEGLGAILAMEEAINEAGLKPSDVDYVNAHATSTSIGDISECKALSKVFDGVLDKVHISGTKSMTGHLLGGAGAIEAIASILAIKNNQIPPTINVTEREPEISNDLQLVLNKSLSKEVNVAINNTFGFGGHIIVTLFKRFKG